MHVITVVFQVKPEHREEFLREMQENARLSVEREPGCHQFDVCVSLEDACTVFLYELYDDKAAFDAHLATEHFQSFNRTTGDWVASKTVKALKRC